MNAQTLKYDTHETEVAELSPAALAYLLQYGWSQSLQDSVAGLAKKLTGTKNPETDADYTEAEIAEAVAEKQAERAKAIVAGTVSVRVGGPRGSKLETIMLAIGREIVSERARTKGIKIDAKRLTELAGDWVAKHDDEARTEATRRMALPKSAAIDDNDLTA